MCYFATAVVEDRTDVYWPHSADAGLKLRGGGGWEVKLREDSDARGFEKWKKYHCSSDSEAIAKAGPSGMPAATQVTVRKRRLRTSVSGCVAEQTDLLVGCGGAEEEWRTVAVEGKRSACTPLLQELLLACESQADPARGAVRHCGYPEFVCGVAARLLSPGSHPRSPSGPSPTAMLARADGGKRIAFATDGFSLVVCRHPASGRWLAVQETQGRGWWLPAGHVDRGQTFAEAARYG